MASFRGGLLGGRAGYRGVCPCALPLISAVLATAYRLAPAEEVRPEEAWRRSLSLYWDSQFSLTILTRLNPMNIRLVETRIVVFHTYPITLC
jgi:hypothetical protein